MFELCNGNPFGYLRRAPIRSVDNELETFEVIKVYEEGDHYFTLHVGELDGVWLAGYDYSMGTKGGYARPCLSFGYFDTREAALVYTLGMLIVDLHLYGKIKRALVEKLNEFRQMEMWRY